MSKLLILLSVVAMLFSTTACSRAKNSSPEADQIKKETAAAHPDDLVAATKSANEALEREVQKSSTTKEAAAIVFLGYYTKNIIGAPSICKEYGINIQEFSDAFIEANRIPFEAASAIVNSKLIIQQAITKAKVSARSELERFAAAEKKDIVGVCSFIKDHSLEMADGAKFANIMPKIYTQLVH